MFNWVTADGYFAATDGNLDWVVPDDEQAKAAAASLPGYDTVLLGRRTYELFAAFWPHVAVDASGGAPDPHDPGRRSREMGAMAVALNAMTKLVFSRSLREVTWRNARLVRELDPSEIDSLKRESGKDMIVFGSGSIVEQLTQHGLIDEYQLAVCPVLIGRGRSLLGNVSVRAKLELLEAKPLPSGDVLLRYARG